MADESSCFVFLPTFDGRSVRQEAVEMIKAEDSHSKKNRSNSYIVHNNEEKFGRGRLIKIVSSAECEDSPSDHGKVIRTAHINIKQESNEVPMVEVADAIIHPRTMVVHAQDATVALPTMMRPWWLVPFACAAIPWSTIMFLHFISFVRADVRFPTIRYSARVCKYAEVVVPEQHDGHDVERQQQVYELDCPPATIPGPYDENLGSEDRE